MNRYDLVLLGLILEKERSGYDIITEISNRELDRWANLSTSTVYNRLTTLEKNECIVGRAERDGNRPERMVFNITEKGREILRKEVLKHLTGFNDDPRTLGFAFLYGADQKEVITLANGIHDAVLGVQTREAERFATDGRRLTAPTRGINIVRMSNGTIQKILVK